MNRTAGIVLLVALCGGVALPLRAAEPPTKPATQEEMVWDGERFVAQPAAEPGTDRADLETIRGLQKQGDHSEVVDAVETFLSDHPTSPAGEEALMLAAEAEMARGHYWDAYKHLERLIASYPNGTMLDRALEKEYDIADAFMKGRKRRALSIFRVSAEEDGLEMMMRVVAHAPGTRLAERALMRVGEFHVQREEYREAVAVYDQFIRSFPNSARRPYAMLEAARSTLRQFKGIKYDTTPLQEAAERFRVFAAAHPRAAQRENIPEVLREIRDTLAHKMYHNGEFYERTGESGAARFYYSNVVEEFPDTPWAKQAQMKLDRLGPPPPEYSPLPPVAERPENLTPPPAGERSESLEALRPPAKEAEPSQAPVADPAPVSPPIAASPEPSKTQQPQEKSESTDSPAASPADTYSTPVRLEDLTGQK